jgi:hypothetical protein
MIVWQFASDPPQEWTEPPECSPWRLGMTNEQLAAWFEECRMAREIVLQQVRLWEGWANIEREAQRDMRGVVR